MYKTALPNIAINKQHSNYVLGLGDMKPTSFSSNLDENKYNLISTSTMFFGETVIDSSCVFTYCVSNQI